MSRYLLSPNDEIESKLTGDPVFPLVRELSFKYGLRVYQVTELFRPHTTELSKRECMMSYEDGLPVCKVWAEKDSSGVHYNYRSPWYEKERGSSSADRETIHSLKLSTIMGTLKRNNVIPSREEIFTNHVDGFGYAVRNFRHTFGDTQKNLNSVTPEQVQSLLVHFLGESPNSHELPLERNICQKILDKYRTIDTIRDRVESETQRFFGNGFYAIGATLESKTLMVGKVKRVADKFECVESFKRVGSLEKYPDLLSLSVMMKVSLEEKYSAEKLCAGFIPIHSCHFPDFDVSTICTNHVPNDFHYAWMLVPCDSTT